MPFTTNFSRETIQKVLYAFTTIIVVISFVLVILGLTVLKPKPTPPQIKYSFIVAQDGSGHFTSVSAAVEAAPIGSKKYFGIFIKPGLYREAVRVPHQKTHLAFIGSGMGVTIVSYNGSSEVNPEEAATVVIEGDGFVAIDMSFEHTGDPTIGYTVALASRARETAFQGCSFKGYSGVVEAAFGFQFYGKSHIYGAVDVVWGNAAAVFQKCAIFVEKPLRGQKPGALTFQQKAYPKLLGGFVFHGCSVVAAAGSDHNQPGISSGSHVFLGRPGGPFSTLIFMECYLGGVTNPSAGWLLQSSLPPKTLYLAEYNNGGPGAVMRKMITPAEAARFTVRSFIKGDDWLAKTTVGYVSGFL